MGSECCQHRKEDYELITGNIIRKKSNKFKIKFKDETELNEIKVAKHKINNLSEFMTGEEIYSAETRNNVGTGNVITPKDSNIHDLYLHSLEIFLTINKIRADPSILIEKINIYLENDLENEICLINDDKNNKIYMPIKILQDIKNYLITLSTTDCIMYEEPLYQIAIKYSESFSKNELNLSKNEIIKKIAEEYSESDVEIKDFILFGYNNIDSYSIILLLLENKENRINFFKENYDYGTVICSRNSEHIPYTLILFLKEIKLINMSL